MKVSFSNIITVLIVVLIGLMAWYWYGRSELIHGDEMPDVTLKGNGYELDLLDLKGNYLYIYFWGSWCGPCRQNNPRLVEFYHRAKNSDYEWAGDFEVVSIALETGGEAWKRISEQAGFAWPYQFVEPRLGNHPAYFGFGVNSIPSSFLIDREGKVVSVNPTYANIPTLIKKLENN